MSKSRPVQTSFLRDDVATSDEGATHTALPIGNPGGGGTMLPSGQPPSSNRGVDLAFDDPALAIAAGLPAHETEDKPAPRNTSYYYMLEHYIAGR